jgi:hypothetical protein
VPEVKTNLRVLQPSRKKRRPGDVFVYVMPDGLFRFGRLISKDAKIGGFPATLVYFYKGESSAKFPVPDLAPANLLVPPLGTNQKPWTLGYFEVVESRPLTGADLLPVHCFRDSRGWYFDERGRRLAHPIEPCGEYGLHSFRTIDDLLSDVLGFPKV